MNSAKRLYGKKYNSLLQNQAYRLQSSFFRSKVNRKLNEITDNQLGPGQYDVALPIIKPNYETIKKNNNTVILKFNHNLSSPFNSKQPRFKYSKLQQNKQSQTNILLKNSTILQNNHKTVINNNKASIFKKYDQHFTQMIDNQEDTIQNSLKDKLLKQTINNNQIQKQLSKTLQISQMTNKKKTQSLISNKYPKLGNIQNKNNTKTKKQKQNMLNYSLSLRQRDSQEDNLEDRYIQQLVHRNYSEQYGQKQKERYQSYKNQYVNRQQKQSTQPHGKSARLHNQQPKIVLNKKLNSFRYNSLETKSTKWSKYKEQRKSFVEEICNQDVPGPGSYRLRQPKYRNYNDAAHITSWQFNSKTSRKPFNFGSSTQQITNKTPSFPTKQQIVKILPGQAQQHEKRKRFLSKKRSKKSLSSFYNLQNDISSSSLIKQQNLDSIILDMTKNNKQQQFSAALHSRENLFNH